MAVEAFSLATKGSAPVPPDATIEAGLKYATPNLPIKFQKIPYTMISMKRMERTVRSRPRPNPPDELIFSSRKGLHSKMLDIRSIEPSQTATNEKPSIGV